MWMSSAAAKGHVWVCGPPTARVVLVYVAHVTTQGHADVYGLCCCFKPCWCLWSMLLLRAVMSPRCCCSWGSCWCSWPCCHWGSGQCPRCMLLPGAMWLTLVRATTWCHVDVHGLGCHRGLHWCPCCPGGHVDDVHGSCYSREISVVCTAIRNYAEICDSCCHQKPCSHRLKRQGRYFSSGIDDHRCAVEKERHEWLLWQPYSQGPLHSYKKKKKKETKAKTKNTIEDPQNEAIKESY